MGCPDLLVAVDHKPLTKIFDDRQLDTIENPRILRLKEKTLMYSFKIAHIAGSSNFTVDFASRNPYGKENTNGEGSEESSGRAHATHQGDGIESVTWNTVYDAASVDG